MTEPLEQLMAQLRATYLMEVPSQLAALRIATHAWQHGQLAGEGQLRPLLHRLAGSAGAYGFGDVTTLCRELEAWLATDPPRGAAAGARIEASLAAIEAAFQLPPTPTDPR